MTIKKFLFQAAILLVFTVVIGLAFNNLSEKPLPIFTKYDPLSEAMQNSKDQTDQVPPVNISEIDAETLKYMVEQDGAILVDARTDSDFQAGHLPGAVSLPVYEYDQKYEQAATFLGENKTNTIITYCSTYTCIDSSLLAQKLYHAGYKNIFVYKGGFHEWSESGNPIETSQSQGNSDISGGSNSSNSSSSSQIPDSSGNEVN